MPQLRGGPGLAEELFELTGAELALARNLDGHDAIEFRVAGLPNGPKTADTYTSNQFKAPQPLQRAVQR
jgi:hypothetical protein